MTSDKALEIFWKAYGEYKDQPFRQSEAYKYAIGHVLSQYELELAELYLNKTNI